jgi:hypothetical protein
MYSMSTLSFCLAPTEARNIKRRESNNVTTSRGKRCASQRSALGSALHAPFKGQVHAVFRPPTSNFAIRHRELAGSIS